MSKIDIDELIAPVLAYLPNRTPEAWVDAALEHQETILIDHATNELKAAQQAMTLMARNPLNMDIQNKMSRLAREELVHYEQVLKIIKKRRIKFRTMKASGYAYNMAQHIRSDNKGKLTDNLIIGSIIEARSCERFHKIAPSLDEELQKFYISLLKSESRHFKDYLALAQKYTDEDIQPRVEFFLSVEDKSILEPDPLMRLHSGMPTADLRV
ncbi:MAG: tRNA-(ms[2]io[6]A)-hydroxylase [Gammaproteobacteria bacterium]|nr:tRNA-(ms[2]io[6]A)-hydroxylase [Gammaproteobacteria bacterium]